MGEEAGLMYWIPLLAGILNASFILDLMVTLGTGESLGSLLSDASGNSVAAAIVENIPTDPTVFWMISGFILFFVCAIECLVIYLAFYSDVSECKKCMDSCETNRNFGKPLGRAWGGRP
jgi:short subunit fatty acids transporter